MLGSFDSARRFYLWLALITVTAFVARVYELDRPSVLFDELASVRDAALFADDPHELFLGSPKMLGYLPVALGMWASGVDVSMLPTESPAQWLEAGVSPAAMRIGPAIVGSISITILGWLSIGILGRRTALIVALLLALSPWHIYWSQMARFYVLQFLLYGVALISYYSGSRDPVPRRSLAKLSVTAIALVLALLTQLTSIVLVAIIAADLIVARLRGERLSLGVPGYVAIAAGTLLSIALLIMAGYWQFVQPMFQQATRLISNSGGAIPLDVIATTSWFVGPAVMFVGILAVWSRPTGSRGLIWFLLIAAFAPILIFSILSLTRPYYGSRYAFMCLFPWLALASMALRQVIDAIGSRSNIVFAYMPLALVIFGMLLVNASYYLYNPGFRPHWNEAFAYVTQNRKPGESVYVDANWRPVGQYYLRQDEILEVRRGDFETAITPSWYVVRTTDPHELLPGLQVPESALYQRSYTTASIKTMHTVFVFFANSP